MARGKRLFDFLLASVGMIFFFPAGLFFALRVRREDGGPIFYTQERWGKGGRKFKALKFRTMIPEAVRPENFAPAQESDRRVTRVGKFLRSTAMDELPQLFNIWKGEMSFVGPRALAVWELDPSRAYFSERHQVRPGLTGPAQVYAPRDAPLEEKFRYDLDYIGARTFWADLKLLFLSARITLIGKWESRDKKI